MTLLIVFGNLAIFVNAQTGFIVFVAPTGDGMSAPFVEVPGQQPTEIGTDLLTVSGSTPAPSVSPDGNWIAVVGQTLQDESNSAYNIYVFSPTGANFHSITSFTNPQQQGLAALPEAITFSPDSSKIAFTIESYGKGASSVSLLFCDVATCTQNVPVGSVSASGFDGMGVAWSPDGESLVSPVTCGVDCPDDPSSGYPVLVTDLRIMPAIANGGNQARELTLPMQSSYSNAMMQVLPSYSPDGTMIAFVVWDMNLNLSPGLSGYADCQSSSIYLVSSQGGTPTLVETIPNVVITSVSWVADPASSGRLLFSAIQPSNGQAAGVWEVNTDGSGLQEVMNNSGDAVWSSSLSFAGINNVSTMSSLSSTSSYAGYKSSYSSKLSSPPASSSSSLSFGSQEIELVLPLVAVISVATVAAMFLRRKSERQNAFERYSLKAGLSGTDQTSMTPVKAGSCRNCGSALRLGARFCENCGSAVS